MRIKSQQLTSKHFLIKDNSTRLSAGTVEVGDAPLSARSPASPHSEVRDAERRGVYPLHDYHARLAVADHHSAAPPFDQKLSELVRIHNPWSLNLNLRVNNDFLTKVPNNKTTTITTFYPTLSGFCLQCLITDLVFSQPPSKISYIGSTSAGAGVRATWQLWGPRYSNFREPERTGPNLYSNWSGVLNSAPSVPIKGTFFNCWVHFM